MPEFRIIVGRGRIIVVRYIVPVAGGIDMAVDCSSGSSIGESTVTAENILRAVAGISGKIIGVRTTGCKDP